MTKINVPLLIFALMIQSALCGMMLLLPASITSQFPAYASPQSIITAATPIDNFGITSLTGITSAIGCSADVFYLNCIATFFVYLIGGIGVVFNIIVYAVVLIGTFLLFFITSGFNTISVFPSWIALPLNVFLLAINFVVIFDIIILIRDTLKV